MPKMSKAAQRDAYLDRARDRGREAALAGIGMQGEADLQAALTEACGPYSLNERSAWLVGHTQVRREMEARARDRAEAKLIDALRSAGLTVEMAAWGELRVVGNDLAAVIWVKDAAGQLQPSAQQ